MREDKRIEKKLLAKGILEYKIIRKILKSIQYRNVFGKTIITESVDDRLLVKFKTLEGVAQFSVSAYQEDDILDKIIELSLKNIQNYSVHWQEENFNNIKKNKSKECEMFYSFSKENYINWLKKEMKNVYEEMKLSLNVVYTVNINKYCLLTHEYYLEQYKADSELICMENTKFKRKANLSNIFLKDRIAKTIIHSLNNIEISLRNINLDQRKYICIKAEGLASILNMYILMYYSSNVYLNQSFIKKNYIGKPISKSKINIITIPYKGICFDGEGCRILPKTIVDSGVVVNLLSNTSYSEYLNINSIGNASLDIPDTISHQKLIFTFKDSVKHNNQTADLTIYKFEHIYIDFKDNKIKGIAICSDTVDYFRTMISFNVKDIFENIYPINNNRSWINNVYCQDILMQR